MTEPTTQERHPARSAIRTGFQALVAIATIIPYFVTEANIPLEGWVAQVVGVAVAVSRVMAMPQVNDFLRRYAPALAPDAEPPAQK